MSRCQILTDKADTEIQENVFTRVRQLKSTLFFTRAMLTCVEKDHKHNTHTLPNVNAKVSMDVCISPNIAFMLSGVTSLMPVESDKTQ